MRLFYSKLINTWSSSESQRCSNVSTMRKLKCRHPLEQGLTYALCTFRRIMFVCQIKGQSTLLNLRRSWCSIIIFVTAARFLWLQTCRWCQWKPLVKGQVSHNAEEASRREQPRRQQRGGSEMTSGGMGIPCRSGAVVAGQGGMCKAFVKSQQGISKSSAWKSGVFYETFASLQDIACWPKLWNLLVADS